MNGAGPVQPLRIDMHGQAPSAAKTRAELKKAVTEFEALFLNQMLKVMRDSVAKSDLFHGGSGEDIYNSLFDTELSGQMAKGGGIGLGKVLLGQFEKNLGLTPGANNDGVKDAWAGVPSERPKKAGKTEGI
jgi:flagellar protein FlgJ